MALATSKNIILPIHRETKTCNNISLPGKSQWAHKGEMKGRVGYLGQAGFVGNKQGNL